jgi:hypothetical protein
VSRSKGALEKEREANKMEKIRKYHGIKKAVGEMPRYNRHDGTYLEVPTSTKTRCIRTSIAASDSTAGRSTTIQRSSELEIMPAA